MDQLQKIGQDHPMPPEHQASFKRLYQADLEMPVIEPLNTEPPQQGLQSIVRPSIPTNQQDCQWAHPALPQYGQNP